MAKARRSGEPAPILAKGTDRRLGAILQRHGGRTSKPDSTYRLPNPPRPTRDDLEGEPELFGDAS